MRRSWFRRAGKWGLVGVAIAGGWMLGSMHAAAPGQDMFETPAEYVAGPAVAISGTGLCGRPVRSTDGAFLWVPRGDHLEQWNIKHAKVVATIPIDSPLSDVVLSADGNTAYAAAGSKIAVVDTSGAGSVTAKIDIGSPVTALAITTEKSPRLLVAAATVVKRINPTDHSSQSIDVGGKITTLVTGGDAAFALIANSQTVVSINSTEAKLNTTWKLDATPLAAAVDVANARLLVACSDRQLRVLDTSTGEVVTTMPIASGTTGICICPSKSTVFIAGAGVIDVLHADDASQYSALKSIPLPPASHGPTIDPDGQLLTIVTDDGGKTTLCVFMRKE